MEISPHSRVQVIDVPILAPGVCVLCNIADGDGRKFVDFGKQVDWYGAVYFCTECISEVSRAIGWVPVAEFNELLDNYKKLTAAYEELTASNRKIKNGLNLILPELGHNPESVGDYIRSLMVSGGSTAESEGTSIEASVGESETNESDNVEGPDDVFDASDFE